MNDSSARQRASSELKCHDCVPLSAFALTLYKADETKKMITQPGRVTS